MAKIMIDLKQTDAFRNFEKNLSDHMRIFLAQYTAFLVVEGRVTVSDDIDAATADVDDLITRFMEGPVTADEA